MSAGLPVQRGTASSPSPASRHRRAALCARSPWSTATLPGPGETSPAGAAKAAESAARVLSACTPRSRAPGWEPGRRPKCARSRRPPPGGPSAAGWAVCARARGACARPCGVCTHKGVSAKPTARAAFHPCGRNPGLEQGLVRAAAKATRAARATRAAEAPRLLAGFLDRGTEAARAGRWQPAPDARRATAGHVPSAQRVFGHSPAAGTERTRGSGMGALQPRGAPERARSFHTGSAKVKWKAAAERSHPPPSLPQLRRVVGRAPLDLLEGKLAAGRVRPRLLRLPLHPRPPGSMPHFFVLNAPPPPRGFSPQGQADGGWGIGPWAPPSI